MFRAPFTPRPYYARAKGGKANVVTEVTMRCPLRLPAALAATLLAGVAAADITPANVGTLVTKWDFPTNGVRYGGVTSSPTLGNGLLYVTSWNGALYALD